MYFLSPRYPLPHYHIQLKNGPNKDGKIFMIECCVQYSSLVSSKISSIKVYYSVYSTRELEKVKSSPVIQGMRDPSGCQFVGMASALDYCIVWIASPIIIALALRHCLHYCVSPLCVQIMPVLRLHWFCWVAMAEQKQSYTKHWARKLFSASWIWTTMDTWLKKIWIIPSTTGFKPWCWRTTPANA